MICFPLAGLFIGLLLTGINFILSLLNFPQFSVNIILVISLIFLTGGLHMDGLSDTADAFLSRKNKEEMLLVMRDPHAGAMGVTALISIVLLKIAFLYSLGVSLKPVSLLLMCIASRWAMVYSLFLAPYARKEGKAKLFARRIDQKILLLATITALTAAILIGRIQGAFVMAAVAFSTYCMTKIISGKLGGITGDTLGAANEIMEVIALFTIYLSGGF